MAKRDFYEVLGVSRDADDKTIKAAYRKLAMANHPDRNPDDEAAAERFREASEAYEVLKDGQKRAAYDQLGHAAFEQSAGFGGGGAGLGLDSAALAAVFPIFLSRCSQNFPVAGAAAVSHAMVRICVMIWILILMRPLPAVPKISLPKFQPLVRNVQARVPQKGSRPATCSGCGGRGKVRAQQGFFTVERTCPSCQGVGETISDPCRSCRGQGRVEKAENLSVNIPSGVDTGTRIRLSGKGEAGLRGAPAGDLYIFVNVKNHPIFEREGSHLFVRVPVPMATAALGGTIDVPTLAGRMARLQIEKGTQTGRKFRMRGKGMPALRGAGQGDQIVEIHVETPTNLTKKQAELLAEFEKAGDASPQTTSFLNRVKRLWS